MVMAVPVIQEASSDTRNKASLAISSGVPKRLSKVAFPAFSTANSGFGKAFAESRINGVSTGPGHIAFTLISGAYSTAICLISANVAAFEAQYAGCWGKLLNAAMDELIKMVLPLPFFK